jgi:hypothetical protein
MREDIESLLEEWGAWSRGEEPGKLWFSSRSNIQKIADSGGVFVEGVSPTMPENPAAEQVDRWVAILYRTHRKEAEAVKEYYVAGGTQHVIARRLRVSIRVYKDRLKYAKVWLSGVMSQRVI